MWDASSLVSQGWLAGNSSSSHHMNPKLSCSHKSLWKEPSSFYLFTDFNLTPWNQTLPHAFCPTIWCLMHFSFCSWVFFFLNTDWIRLEVFYQNYWKWPPGCCSLLFPFVYSSLQAPTQSILLSSYLQGQPSLLVAASHISFFQDAHACLTS